MSVLKLMVIIVIFIQSCLGSTTYFDAVFPPHPTTAPNADVEEQEEEEDGSGCSEITMCPLSPCDEWAKCASYPTATCYYDYCDGCTVKFIDPISRAHYSFSDCNKAAVPPHIALRRETVVENENENDNETETESLLLEVDQYQKTRDNFGVNLNDEMIDIGKDLINYGDLDIDVGIPAHGQRSHSDSDHPNNEYNDDPVFNKYAIDNIQKTRDNMGLNLNDEMIDIGNDLINYGRLHIRLLPQAEFDENESAQPQKQFAAVHTKGNFIVSEPKKMEKVDHEHHISHKYFIGAPAVAVVAFLFVFGFYFFVNNNQSKKNQQFEELNEIEID